jgi:hypothetical protein
LELDIYLEMIMTMIEAGSINSGTAIITGSKNPGTAIITGSKNPGMILISKNLRAL